MKKEIIGFFFKILISGNKNFLWLKIALESFLDFSVFKTCLQHGRRHSRRHSNDFRAQWPNLLESACVKVLFFS
jgi:hypothetical protein